MYSITPAGVVLVTEAVSTMTRFGAEPTLVVSDAESLAPFVETALAEKGSTVPAGVPPTGVVVTVRVKLPPERMSPRFQLMIHHRWKRLKIADELIIKHWP